jgi:hypothetical protein
MLNLLLIQNRHFNEFIRHVLECRGDYNLTLCNKLKKHSWSVWPITRRPPIIEKRESVTEFLNILKSQGIKYSIKKTGDFGEPLETSQWVAYSIVIRKSDVKLS